MSSLSPSARLNRVLGQSAILVVLGLVIQAATLYWNHPLSFLSFAFVGGTAIVLGVARYLFAVMTYSEAPALEEPAAE